MGDWDCFVEEMPWFLSDIQSVEIGKQRHGCELSQDFVDTFPTMSRLLTQADITDVRLDDTQYELFGWDAKSGHRAGWLCLPKPKEAEEHVCPDHAILLTGFGGIVERFNEPECWLNNLNDSLTHRLSHKDASFLQYVKQVFDDAGVDIPIEQTDYYSIAEEANGNTTLCHRRSADILFFAFDHAFDHIQVFENCPPYTLYTINGVSTFTGWVEEVARQWMNHLDDKYQQH